MSENVVLYFQSTDIKNISRVASQVKNKKEKKSPQTLSLKGHRHNINLETKYWPIEIPG